MTPGSSGALPRSVELATLVDDLRGWFATMIVSEAALLEGSCKLDVALADGGDSGAALAELERVAKRYAAAQDALRDLAPVVSQLLDGDEKFPSELPEGERAQAGA